MLNIYSFDKNHSVPVENFSDDCWVDIQNPSPEEIRLVAEKMDIEIDHIMDSLDRSERPHTVVEDERIFIVNRIPIRQEGEGKTPFGTVPVGIIITEKALITICPQEGLVYSLFEGKLKGKHNRAQVCAVLTILHEISSVFIEYLEEIDATTDKIEQSMRESMRNEELDRMMMLQKSLVYFMTALKGNALVLEKMVANNLVAGMDDERELLTSALIENRQATEMAAVYSEIVRSMSDTFAAMISNNMNIVMKFLAGITLVLMAPTIVVGFYGMNVSLPLQDSPWALYVIIGVTVTLCTGVWAYLAKRHWM